MKAKTLKMFASDGSFLKEKKLTNVRASGSDDTISIAPPRKMSLEQVLGYLNDDELAEITPESIRLRKRHLDENKRKRVAKTQKEHEASITF